MLKNERVCFDTAQSGLIGKDGFDIQNGRVAQVQQHLIR